MTKDELEFQKKVMEAKMLLDTFEIPKRPITLSAHQFKKKFGSNQGYSEYKKTVKKERADWDVLYKESQKLNKQKIRCLTQVSLSDDAFQEAGEVAKREGIEVQDILSRWLEHGRNS